MEWRAMDKSKTNIAGNSPLQSVQRAWRSILPEFSFLLEFVHMEERKTRLLSTQKTGQDGWDVISSPCLINKRSRFRWGFYVRDDVDWRNAIELHLFFSYFFFLLRAGAPGGRYSLQLLQMWTLSAIWEGLPWFSTFITAWMKFLFLECIKQAF